MNSIWIVIAVAVWMFLGYRFYGRFIEKRLKINDKNVTPAVKYEDDEDFSPSKKPFLIGHHFAAIAGAGPVVGPILAISYFGWLPVVLWVSIGSVLIGAMHDYVSLIASVRNKAKGVSNIAKDYLNSRSGWIFGLMIWVTLVLVVAVFSASTADSLIQKPELGIPLLTVTVLALLLGILVEKGKANYQVFSGLAIVLIFASVWVGMKYPIDFGIEDANLLKNIFVTIIIAYGGIAALVPVWMLLRPRDYLSAIQMFATVSLGVIAILIVRPVVNAPMYIKSEVFPIWPILFITVACGAISGFHGLVSSGTTSKQLSKESHGRAVGYGGMLGEGAIAILVTIVAIAGLKWGVGEGTFSFALEKGWIVLFSEGFGNIVGSVGIPLITVGVAGLLGAFMINQFILTTVDSASRLGRYVISENLFPKLKSKIIAVLITIIPAWILAITNSYEVMWRLFGTSNQLIASISLIAVSAYFISTKKKVKFMIIPALFVLITTLYALIYLSFRSGGYFASGNYELVALAMFMFVLGIVVAVEGMTSIRKNWKKA